MINTHGGYDPTTATQQFPFRAWEKPRLCEPNGGNCVEVAFSPAGVIGLRDTKASKDLALLFDHDEWGTFVAAVKAGQYDLH